LKTSVVSGGAGFIGSHLCDFLLAKGNKVICIDNFVTGSRKNIAHLEGNKNFSLLEADITQEFEVKEKVDEVYNLSSPASPVDFPKIPIEILLVNSIGTKNLLELAAKNKARFLEASTSEVYGDPLEHPQKETYWGNVNCTGVRSCYDEGKRFSEAIVMAFWRKKNLQTKIARIFNTYGPRMRAEDGRVIPNFINQALRGEPITVYGNGKQTRSFCFVSDLVEGLFKLMQSSFSDPVNLGNPNEMNMLELAEKVKAFTGSKSEISFKPLPVDDPAKRRPDISRAKKELGWEPKVSFEEGLKKTIDFFKSIE